MKYFILAVILFFGLRCFSQSFNYYYVDEYIRATEDPNYTEYLKEKQQEDNSVNKGVDEYKEERRYQAWLQEQERQEYIDERSQIEITNFEKEEKEYEKLKEKEEKAYLALQVEYVNWKDGSAQQKWTRANPGRMIASMPTYEVVPKQKRKYKFKTPSKK